MIQYVALMALLQAGPVDLLIKGGTVVTMDEEMRVLEEGSVAIRGDRIEAVKRWMPVETWSFQAW
jgi:cytosine/adenosine deaminase-related metal-dependent hydrolase